MSSIKWRVQPENILSSSLVIPVIVIHDLEQTLAMAEALFAGGIKVLEITLRTPAALDALKLLTQKFPEQLIGAGTVINAEQLQEVIAAGAKFAFSPGQTRELLLAGKEQPIPLIPGITTVSELMEAMSLGYKHFKFFPAALAGGIPMLRTFYSLFPEIKFCPTGGINQQNCAEYLALPNVSCVGGSWLVSEEAIKNAKWSHITNLCLSVKKRGIGTI
ncbi:MAG: bifunctional 4-hydroxy-2-oxoglutarate aldolase/2-dehydro-3-deoxy-phosphogluconate aldolase [Legionella sp.]|nr:MAG: bifunctional 4-hydroxy-2-oxoglutarate aldolase/2-dehydro-3-deoxy-phosphogluconate aldolase [Legionella sp.]